MRSFSATFLRTCLWTRFRYRKPSNAAYAIARLATTPAKPFKTSSGATFFFETAGAAAAAGEAACAEGVACAREAGTIWARHEQEKIRGANAKRTAIHASKPRRKRALPPRNTTPLPCEIAPKLFLLRHC